jgi:hypothetical protein
MCDSKGSGGRAACSERDRSVQAGLARRRIERIRELRLTTGSGLAGRLPAAACTPCVEDAEDDERDRDEQRQ